jgi:hypothetical protein
MSVMSVNCNGHVHGNINDQINKKITIKITLKVTVMVTGRSRDGHGNVQKTKDQLF